MMPSTLDKGYSPECPEVVFSEVHIQHSPGPMRHASPDRVERIFLIIPVGASLFAAAILAGYDRAMGTKKSRVMGENAAPRCGVCRTSRLPGGGSRRSSQPSLGIIIRPPQGRRCGPRYLVL